METFDGAWQADFGSALGGRGIVLLREGRVMGPDNPFFYEVYGWFTEDFDTADLKEAKALLEELSA